MVSKERKEYMRKWWIRNIDKRKAFNGTRTGYTGKYKGKCYRFKDKLPDGKVRHHQFYNDNNPNDGIVYMGRKEHSRLHTIERIFMETGGWKI